VNRLEHGATLLPHRLPDCPGRWAALTDCPPYGDAFGRRARTVTLLCWECGVRYDLGATSSADDDPGAYDLERVPDEHRPYLGVSYAGAGALELGAAVPPRKVAGVLVHADRGIAWSRDPWDDAYWYLVTDRDGNVLGRVQKGRGPRGGDVYSVGAGPDDCGHGWHAADFRTLAAAVKALTAVVL
jgi:hypothetical protein